MPEHLSTVSNPLDTHRGHVRPPGGSYTPDTDTSGHSKRISATRPDVPARTTPGAADVTWTVPDRLPTRHSLQPTLPADVAALVAAGHLVEVSPNVYRRAPRRATP